MKIFLLFLLTFVVATAAPLSSASGEHNFQHVILAEIIHSVKESNDSLTAEIFVPNVITTERCTLKNFCKAGNILSVYKAEELGLKERDWLLPRKLVAYTRDVQCKSPASEDRINLRQLLSNIYRCAQQAYTKTFNVSTLSPFS